jgi:hypothetical protein
MENPKQGEGTTMDHRCDTQAKNSTFILANWRLAQSLLGAAACCYLDPFAFCSMVCELSEEGG